MRYNADEIWADSVYNSESTIHLSLRNRHQHRTTLYHNTSMWYNVHETRTDSVYNSESRVAGRQYIQPIKKSHAPDLKHPIITEYMYRTICTS